MNAAASGIMKRTVLCLMLGGWALALAQAPPAEENPGSSVVEGQTQPCVPAGESAADAGESGIAGPEAPPCPEPENGTAVDAPGSDPAAAVEEDQAVQASADEVFTPGDEISEDFPVPLPADI